MALKLWSEKLLRAIIFMMSSYFNTRLTESSSYGLWNHVLYEVARPVDDGQLIICPQFEIYVSPAEGELPDNPNISNLTAADSKARGVYVDFAIVHTKIQPREQDPPILIKSFSHMFNLLFQRYDPQATRQAYAFITTLPVLIELKRPASRHIKIERWIGRTFKLIDHAKSQSLDQARCLFTSRRYGYEQNEVILIAAAGEWFCIRLVIQDSTISSDDAFNVENYELAVQEFTEEDAAERFFDSLSDPSTGDDDPPKVASSSRAREEAPANRQSARLEKKQKERDARIVKDLQDQNPPFTDDQLDAAVRESTLAVFTEMRSWGPPNPLGQITEKDVMEWTKPMRVGSPIADKYLMYVQSKLKRHVQNVGTE